MPQKSQKASFMDNFGVPPHADHRPIYPAKSTSALFRPNFGLRKPWRPLWADRETSFRPKAGPFEPFSASIWKTETEIISALEWSGPPNAEA